MTNKTDKNSNETRSGRAQSKIEQLPTNTNTGNNDGNERLKTLARITYEKWFEKYHPIKNPLDSNASFDGCMFETYGEELEFVCAQQPLTIWTLVDCDGKDRIAEGFHYVNRLGYFITEVEAPANRYFSIKAD